MYPEFRYFLEAYCAVSLDGDEFQYAIDEFISRENKRLQQTLHTELKEIMKNNRLTLAREMIEEHGNRVLSPDEASDWLTLAIQKLQEEKE
ncbi:MAG: hypothetical protein ACI35R_13800 [Bacillus sp. (in: firmicutes)]